jgi:hypothetical protein
VAARFLGVAVDRMPAAPKGTTQDAYNDATGTLWEYPRSAAGAVRPQATVIVNCDLCYVEMAYLNEKGPWGTKPATGGAVVTLDVAQATALAFARVHCPFWSPSERQTLGRRKDNRWGSIYEFEWRGLGPQGFHHELRVEVTGATGEVGFYRADLTPPDPESGVPILVSKEQAEARVEEQAARLFPPMAAPIKAEVGRLWTRTEFSEPGRPAYLVTVRGGYRDSAGNQFPFTVICGVDANTGEILTRPRPGASPASTPPSPRLSPQEACAKALGALPSGAQEAEAVMPKPTVAYLIPTMTSPVAPAGVFVYPVQVSAKLPSPADPKVLIPWAQTWGVDAVSGRVWGLRPPWPGAATQ